MAGEHPTTIPESPRTLELIDEEQYLDRIVSDVKKTTPGDRVLLTTMGFGPEETPVARIMDELEAAGERGVDVRLGVDAYNFLIDDKGGKTGPLLYRRTLPDKMQEPFSERLAALKALGQTAGGQYVITNMPYRPLTNPFAGRSHIKVGIINDQVYVGGCNFLFTERQDSMASWRDSRTADWLFGLLSQVFDTGNTQTGIGEDRNFTVDQSTELLVDAGFKNKSVIYDRALQLVDDARESILFLCQYTPDEEMAQKLKEAHDRGVSVQAYYNNPNKAGGPAKYWQKFSVLRSVLNSDVLRQLPLEYRFMHSKILASEKAAMIGSHNYHRLGVRWGTAEATLVREDRSFAQDVSQFVTRQTVSG